MCEGFELAYALFSVESRLKLGIIITGIDVAVGFPVDVAGRLVAVGREDLGIIVHAGQLPGHFRVGGDQESFAEQIGFRFSKSFVSRI